MRIASVSGIAGRGDSGLIRPVPDAETLPYFILLDNDLPCFWLSQHFVLLVFDLPVNDIFATFTHTRYFSPSNLFRLFTCVVINIFPG